MHIRSLEGPETFRGSERPVSDQSRFKKPRAYDQVYGHCVLPRYRIMQQRFRSCYQDFMKVGAKVKSLPDRLGMLISSGPLPDQERYRSPGGSGSRVPKWCQ